MRCLILFFTLMFFSATTYSQEDYSDNLKGINTLAVLVDQNGNLKTNIEYTLKKELEMKLMDNNIKVSDDYYNAKYRLLVCIISQSIKEGYFTIITFDILEPAKLKRFNKEFHCRNYNALLTGVITESNLSNDILDLADALLDDLIYEIKKDNQK
jgi:hypothetical protein